MPSSSKSNTILIVDDNPHNLQVLGNVLKDNNYEAEFATNGKAALEWLKNKQFDLILLDINMPGMNGFDVCKIIRSDITLSELPVIFLSADADRETILKGFEYGAQDYVTKPFDSRELMARVKTHLALKKSREQLKNLNLSLEEKVRERTQQLKEAFDKLETANLQLKELDIAKADFLKMISHQIRTPLNGLSGSIEILKEHKESEEIIKMIEILDISVKRLEKFSLNALLITEIKTERENFSKNYIPLSQLISNCLNDYDLSNLISNRSIKVEVSNMYSDLKIQGNLRLLQTAIINVLDNAIQFSDAESAIKLNVILNDKDVVLEIIDHGIAFPPKSIKIINEQLSSNELPINPNLGLGLNLVKLIMDFHYGKIILRNNKDTGTCVSLQFVIG